jgi:Lrp/AsnC family transcriptional regulator
MKDINPIDRKILRELQRDSDQNLDTLSDKVNLSRNACWRRIKTLQERGVIRKRVALLDPDHLDLGLAVFIQIRAARHAPEWLDKFSRAIKGMPDILGAYRMTGDLDYLIHARVSDMQDYDRLYQQLVRRVEMSDVSASFVMEASKETTQLPV